MYVFLKANGLKIFKVNQIKVYHNELNDQKVLLTASLEVHRHIPQKSDSFSLITASDNKQEWIERD